MADLTLEYSGTTQTLAEWGADSSSVLSLQNQTAGTLTLHFPGMLDADVPFAYKGKIILRLGDSVIFRGHALDPKREGEGSEEGLTIQFVDAWWFLANGTITQTIYDAAKGAAGRNGTLTSGSAVVTLADTTGLGTGMTVTGTGIPAETTILSLGSGTMTLSANATVSGAQALRFIGGTPSNLYALFARLALGSAYNHITVSDTLSAIIAACDAHHGGGVISFGACHGDAFALLPQPVDVKGTFDTAVKAALAFVADAVSQMNYATDPPELSFYQRAAADVKTLAFADERLHIRQDIQARHDLQIKAARILYQYYLTDGSPASAIDAAGDFSDPAGVIQVQFEMHPPSQAPTFVPAVVESQYLESITTNETDKDWWFDNADLEVVDSSDITVGATRVDLDPDAPENAGITDLTDTAGCTRRIVSGAVPSWLSATAHVRYIRVRAFLTLTIWNDPDDHTKGSKTVQRRIALCFAGTDLSTDTYTNEITAAHTDGGTFDPESPPSGIAAAIVAAQGVLQYQGEGVLTDDECDFSYAPAQVLNISGGRDEWTAMKAQIQGVTHQLQTGTTSITFGPAQHLAPQDYLEITRRLGRLQPALQLDSRTEGNTGAGGGGTVHHPAVQARIGIKQTDNFQSRKDVDSSGSVESTVASGKVVYSDGTTTITLDSSSQNMVITDGTKSITLDLNDLPAAGVAKFQSVNVCVGGVQKTAYVLMTTPA